MGSQQLPLQTGDSTDAGAEAPFPGGISCASCLSMPREVARYGWIPDLPDHRDFVFAASPTILRKLPPRIDLTSKCPPIYDQGQIGSCTANAISGAIQFDLMKQKVPKVFIPSRLFVYYNERAMENTINDDSGAMLRDGIKSLAKEGVCPEKMWPYDPTPFPPNPHLTKKPSASCYKEALKHTAVEYRRVTRNLSQMKGCLASGYSFVLGFTVYDSFESDTVAKTGVVPMPARRENVLGGHAVLAVGYDDKQSRLRMRNSWGRAWGVKGYFTMPYAYLLDDNLSDDFWKITLVR
jgi:C1A family cysteine protease